MAPFARVLLVFLPLAAATFAAFWLGVVPRTLSPLSPLSLEKRDQWFIDLKLAGLRLDPVLCQSVLKQPYVGATPVQDTPPTNGCGWINSVRFSEIGGANMSVQPLTCEMTAALTLWVTHEVQAAAKAIFGSPVARIDHMGTYRCRNIEGKHRRSEHASANAIDISGFTLKDGRKISVLHHWQDNGPEAKFLRRAQVAACRYFRATLGPNYNTAHADHFHFDRGVFWACK